MMARPLILVLSLAAAVAVRAQAPADSWPQFRKTPALSGVAASPLPAPLRLLWTHEAGSPVES